MPQQLKFPEDRDSLRVMIAVPSMDSNLKCLTASSLHRVTLDLLQQGFRSPQIHLVMQESILPHARNCLVAEFLASDCTDLVCIDADMVWSPEAFLRLLLHPVEMVGATYRKKVATVMYNIQWAFDADNRIIQDDDTGLLEAEGLPFGFMRIKRTVIERMIAELKPRKYKVPRGDKFLIVHKLFDLEFDDGPDGPDGDDGNYWGEDYVFCRRWRSIGGKVWCDPHAQVHHIGQYIYEGHLAGWLSGIRTEEEIKAEGARLAAEMAKDAAA